MTMGKIKLHLTVKDEGLGDVMRYLSGKGNVVEGIEWEDEVELKEQVILEDSGDPFFFRRGKKKRKQKKVKKIKIGVRNTREKSKLLMNLIIDETGGRYFPLSRETIVGLAGENIVGMVKSSVAGFLTKMCKEKKLKRVGRGQYKLGPKVLVDK